MIAWHMLSRDEDYAFARPSLTREKIRKLELITGAKHERRRERHIDSSYLAALAFPEGTLRWSRHAEPITASTRG